VGSTAIGQRLDSTTGNADLNRPASMSTEQENPTVVTQSFRIPEMSSRQGVRAISACVSDVPGVRTVEAHPDTRTLSVTGTADATDVQTAIRRAGYQAIILSEPDSTRAATPARRSSGEPLTSN
jgi:copper chaperone CopZ